MRHPLAVTLCVLLSAVIVLVLYDFWLYHWGGSAATISWHAYVAAKAEPIIPFVLGWLIGLLIGHLFWPNCGP